MSSARSDIALDNDEWTTAHPHVHKDTAHWCKGRVGVRHEPTVVRSHAPLSRTCGVRESYREPAAKVWHCGHQVRCEGCGKVLEALPSDDCPDRPA